MLILPKGTSGMSRANNNHNIFASKIKCDEHHGLYVPGSLNVKPWNSLGYFTDKSFDKGTLGRKASFAKLPV